MLRNRKNYQKSNTHNEIAQSNHALILFDRRTEQTLTCLLEAQMPDVNRSASTILLYLSLLVNLPVLYLLWRTLGRRL